MSRTYLSHVELRDFRTFGRFRLDIAPGPGLTLMVGSNGLGKSSFFDGIEWCLSGRIRRFADYVGRLTESAYLTRRDAEAPDSHFVSLGFNASEAFTRSASSGPDAAQLIALLKTDGWGEIKDLAAYLNLTHFLGQAAQQRFTSRSKNDQWEALKGPSGIDRLEEVRLALRGPATTAAFRRRLAQQVAEVEVAEQALSRWSDDSARLSALRASAQAFGMPLAETIERDLKALETACKEAGLHTAAAARTGDRTRALIAVREEIGHERARTLDGQRQVERLHLLATRYEALAAVADTDGAAADAARVTVGEATAALSLAALASRSVEKQGAMEAKSVATAKTALWRSSELAKTTEMITELVTSVARFAERKDALLASLRVADATRITAMDALTAARVRQVARRTLQERRVVSEGVVARAGRLTALTLEAKTAEERAIHAREDAAAAATSAGALRGHIDGLRNELTAGEAELATARRRTSEMADALVTVAKHIGQHDEHCPVCATKFPIGALASLAEAASRGQNKELTRQAQKVEAIRRSLEEAMAGLAAVDESGVRADTASAVADAARKALVNARVEVATLVGAGPGDDLPTLADRRLATTMEELAGVEADIILMDASIAELEAMASDAERRHEMLRMERDGMERDIAAGEKRIGELTQTLGSEAHTANSDALTARIEADQRVLAEAEGQQLAIQIELAAALAAETNARQRLDAVDAARIRAEKTIADARTERQDLMGDWTAAGLAGEPSGRGAAGHGETLARRLAEIDGLLTEADRLARALQEFAASSEMQALEGRMAKQVGEDTLSDLSQHERTLQLRLDGMRAARRATEQTHTAVKAYTVQLQKKADRFSTEFLMPLNGLIGDFNKTLLGTPGEMVQFSADAAVNRTVLGMQLRYADEVDNSRYDTSLAPQLVLSEGQMAANGFSILCAASVAYKWSNWRALLLDDPLQHNDIIHAAAFADVMRNLVEYEGYQLLMSSHDRAEGEFLFRKFDAAGLPCTMVTLIAPSRGGVLHEPPRHNAAASRLLARPLAAAG